MLVGYSTRLMRRASFLVSITLLAGCNLPGVDSPQRFRLISAPDGKLYRIDGQSGDVHLITEKGLMPVPKHGRITMEVGRLYVSETGELMAYEGSKKFGPAIDALMKQYGGEKKGAP